MRDLDRVLKALSHPLRRRILEAIVDDARSASDLSREFGIGLGTVSYHLNRILDRECEVVELVDTVMKRGALEKFFRLKAEALKRPSGSGSVEQVQVSVEESVLAVVLGVVEPPVLSLPPRFDS